MTEVPILSTLKRAFAFSLAILICLCLVVPLACADNSNVIVYVTDTGTKYHKSGCSYLLSKNERTLRDAVEDGYTACSRCKPPIPDFEYTVKPKIRPDRSGNTSSSHSSGNRSRYDGSKSDGAIILLIILLFFLFPYLMQIIVYVFSRIITVFGSFLNSIRRIFKRSRK